MPLIKSVSLERVNCSNGGCGAHHKWIATWAIWYEPETELVGLNLFYQDQGAQPVITARTMDISARLLDISRVD